MTYSHQVAAKRCIDCFLNEKDENEIQNSSEIQKWTRHFLKLYDQEHEKSVDK